MRALLDERPDGAQQHVAQNVPEADDGVVQCHGRHLVEDDGEGARNGPNKGETNAYDVADDSRLFRADGLLRDVSLWRNDTAPRLYDEHHAAETEANGHDVGALEFLAEYTARKKRYHKRIREENALALAVRCVDVREEHEDVGQEARESAHAEREVDVAWDVQEVNRLHDGDAAFLDLDLVEARRYPEQDDHDDRDVVE